MCHVADKFYAAVRALTNDGSVKQRLICAYGDHLEALAEDDVPDAIRARFAALRQAMNAVPATEKETAVQVSVRKMSPADAGRFTLSILAMFAELVRAKATGERLGSGSSSSDSARAPDFNRLATGVRVPAFLAG